MPEQIKKDTKYQPHWVAALIARGLEEKRFPSEQYVVQPAHSTEINDAAPESSLEGLKRKINKNQTYIVPIYVDSGEEHFVSLVVHKDQNEKLTAFYHDPYGKNPFQPEEGSQPTQQYKNIVDAVQGRLGIDPQNVVVDTTMVQRSEAENSNVVDCGPNVVGISLARAEKVRDGDLTSPSDGFKVAEDNNHTDMTQYRYKHFEQLNQLGRGTLYGFDLSTAFPASEGGREFVWEGELPSRESDASAAARDESSSTTSNGVGSASQADSLTAVSGSGVGAEEASRETLSGRPRSQSTGNLRDPTVVQPSERRDSAPSARTTIAIFNCIKKLAKVDSKADHVDEDKLYNALNDNKNKDEREKFDGFFARKVDELQGRYGSDDKRLLAEARKAAFQLYDKECKGKPKESAANSQEEPSHAPGQ